MQLMGLDAALILTIASRGIAQHFPRRESLPPRKAERWHPLDEFEDVPSVRGTSVTVLDRQAPFTVRLWHAMQTV